MPGQLQRSSAHWPAPVAPLPGPPVPPGLPLSDEGGVNWKRVRSAWLRYWWLIVTATVLGGVLGVTIARQIAPQYQAFATIWINSESPQDYASGPIRGEGLLTSTSWPELLTSFAILDSVSRKMQLYVHPAKDAPVGLFARFEVADHFVPGSYELRLDSSGRGYRLLDPRGLVLEQGAIGDSVGSTRGFRWAPTAALLGGSRSVAFTVSTLRDASMSLRDHLSMAASRESSILPVMLTGRDPQKTAMTLRTLIAEFEATASRLKTRHLVEFAKTLDQQLAYAAEQLRESEAALEAFRVRTITLPSDGGSTAGGDPMTDPVFRHFFDQRLRLDSIRGDRAALDEIIRAVQARQATAQSLLSVPAAHAAPELTAAITELTTKQATLRATRESYTDQSQRIVDLRASIDRLEHEVIPMMATNLANRMRKQENDLDARLDSASRSLRQIPTRTIEEMRLRRNVDARLALYTTLKGRYEEAQLAQASSLPDMSVLDYPVVPQWPVRSERYRLAGITLFASVAFGLGLALFLDYHDRRFRYPEQATHELRTEIVGVVPRVKARRSAAARAEQSWQLTEAFRTLRLSLSQMKEEDAFTVLVTSPGSGDGKSFVSANLALSYANTGHRTVLIDADVHRGGVHEVFDVPKDPGLADYLAGSAALDDVIRQTEMGVSLIAAGATGRQTAELLASPRMHEAIEALRQRFDVVIVDSPPLCAGVDALVLGTQTRNLLLVLRVGQTDRRLADAKLQMVDRLPIRVLGAVLNGVQIDGSYRYYGYHYVGVDRSADAAGGRVAVVSPV